MTKGYTPTTEQVLADYMPDEEDIGFDSRMMPFGEWKRLKTDAFDRWLAAHDAQARADEVTRFVDSVGVESYPGHDGQMYWDGYRDAQRKLIQTAKHYVADLQKGAEK
ncbi:hypothetical protein [Bifidobacterium sp.]|uniref:hypothetical protein n=1 Tax=Bifidobacterium sp. TaxID=41200 RepID=UPI0039EADAAC